MQESWDTPLKPPLKVGVSTNATPHQHTPGLRPEDLNLWGSGVQANNSQRNDADDTSEEAQLLARLAVLKAKKREPSRDWPVPTSLTRSTYNQVDLWGSPQARPGATASPYSTSDFIVPRRDDVNSGGSNRTISFLTKPLVIDKIEDQTYENLTKMKEQVQQGYRDGYSTVDKKGYFGKIALRTIEDTLARIYEEQNTTLFYQNKALPARTPYDTRFGRIRDSLGKFRN